MKRRKGDACNLVRFKPECGAPKIAQTTQCGRSVGSVALYRAFFLSYDALGSVKNVGDSTQARVVSLAQYKLRFSS